MKTLSIKQPWAWLIVSGLKDIENRSWLTSYRGPLLIHAGKRPDNNLQLILNWAESTSPGIEIPTLDYGGIVGTVDLVDCVTRSKSIWFDGPYGWVLENPKPLPFAPVRGRLGLFEVDYP